MSAMLLFLTTCAIFAIFLYCVHKRIYGYWERRNVPFVPPVPILGNYGDHITLKSTIMEVISELCKKYPNEPYFGVYYGTEPTLIVQDLELIKLIITKDFHYFNAREVSKYANKEVLTRSVVFSGGEEWKTFRQHITPLFTSGKLKNMFPLIQKCVALFETYIDEQVKSSSDIEIKSVMAKYMMDCVGSCVFGITTNTMKREPKVNPFTIVGEKIFDISDVSGYKLVCRSIWPRLFYLLGLKKFPEEANKFFFNIIGNVIQSRRDTPPTRNDFIDLMLHVKNKETEKLEDQDLIGQCMTLFGAGYETSSMTLSCTLFELAKNQMAQMKATAEVDDFFVTHDTIEYDSINELPYLEACFNETMRLYPVISPIKREVLDNYTLPTGLVLEKGVRIHIPTFDIHRNPKYFERPNEFRPERFYGDEKNKIVPYSYLGFGEGPMSCVGSRFAKLQMYPALMTILKKYRLQLCDGMPASLQYNPKGLTTIPKNGIHLKMIPRDQ